MERININFKEFFSTNNFIYNIITATLITYYNAVSKQLSTLKNTFLFREFKNL